MAWVYLVDTHCVIFYHSPPQLRLFEADFGLPTHDAIFDAIDPAEASAVTLDNPFYAPPLTLRSVVQKLMEDEPIDLEAGPLQVNSLFGLFLILSGKIIIPPRLEIRPTNLLPSTSLRLI